MAELFTYTKREQDLLSIVAERGIGKEVTLDQIASDYYKRKRRPQNWRSGLASALRSVCTKSVADRRYTLVRKSGIGRGAIGTYELRR